MSQGLVAAVASVLSLAGRVILGYFMIMVICQAALAISSAAELRHQRRLARHVPCRRLQSSELTPAISVLVPVHNEAATIEHSVRALLTLEYPNLEVVLVDDGSTDDTLDRLRATFDLAPVQPVYEPVLSTAPIERIWRSRRFPNLVVAGKANGGKADALNAALNLATGGLVCAVDADTLIEPEALAHLVRPFLRDARVAAVGGTIRVVNGARTRHGRLVGEPSPRRPLVAFQTLEYLRAFLLGRVGWNRLGGNLLISGAFGLFRRESLIDTGGYVRTVGEDVELVVRLRRYGYELGKPSRVEFAVGAVAWTEAPATLRALGRQRDRWHRGLTDTIWRHRRLIGNPRYGALGLVVLPVYLVVEWFAPVVEAVGMLSLLGAAVLGRVAWHDAALFFALAYGLGLLYTLLALLFDEASGSGDRRPVDLALLVLWSGLEIVGYRQLTVYWRLRGLVRFLLGCTEWGRVERQGFDNQPTGTQPTGAQPTGAPAAA